MYHFYIEIFFPFSEIFTFFIILHVQRGKKCNFNFPNNERHTKYEMESLINRDNKL